MKVVVSQFMDDSALTAFGAGVEIAGEAGLAADRDAPNRVLTPHIAGVTQQANARVPRLTVGVKREPADG